MHDSESASLRWAAILLLATSTLRWGISRVEDSISVPGVGVLEEHAEAIREATVEDARARRPLEEGERIDPNRADVVELDRLPGIGPSTARAIVKARDGGMVFRAAKDLMAVRGLGPASVARLEPWLDLSNAPPGRRGARSRATGASTQAPIDVNRAGEDELRRLPGVGPVLAARIVAERGNGPFSSLADLSRVSGIGPAMVERLEGLAIVRRGR
jgi:competence ComEA-like helix-hairpin-helix protein